MDDKSIAVIYKSRYGSTKKYATWIAEELNAPIFEATSITPAQLAEYDTVIYGGGIYAGGINGIKLVTKNPCKSLVVFTVGITDPQLADYSSVLSGNFTDEMKSKIKTFHFRGGVDYKNIKFIHKSLMTLVKKVTERKPEHERTAEDNAVLETHGKATDFTDKAAIAPLVDYVRKSRAIQK